MKENLVNPLKDKYPQYLSFSLTILLLALTFFLSMTIALQGQNIFRGLEKLKPKIKNKELTRTTTKTDSWNLYTNFNYNFSIEYPDYPTSVVVKEDNNKVQIYRKTPSGPYEYAEFPEFQITIIENKTSQTGEDWIEHQSDIKILLTKEEYSNLKWINYGDWIISSEPVATFGHELYAYKFTDGKIVQVTSTKPRSEFVQILSTFKFTEVTISSPKPTGSKYPVAGICGDGTSNNIVEAKIGIDNVPSPRCIKVTPNQKLRIINNSNFTIKVDIGKYNFDIEPGEDYIFNEEFGEYLGPGVHSIGGIEVWLQ